MVVYYPRTVWENSQLDNGEIWVHLTKTNRGLPYGSFVQILYYLPPNDTSINHPCRPGVCGLIPPPAGDQSNKSSACPHIPLTAGRGGSVQKGLGL